MANLQSIRPRLYALLVTLLVIDIAMVIYLMSPLRGRPQKQQRDLMEAKSALRQKRIEVAPLSGMDQKLKTTQEDLDRFYGERFPSQESQIAFEIGRLAKSSGVNITNAKYDLKDYNLPGAKQVNIDAQMQGDYLNDVKFINALERDRMFFLLNGIQLQQEQQNGTVQIHLTMEAFLRS